MQQNLWVIENENNGASYFSEKSYELGQLGGMWISEQQSAINFRHRKSLAGYASDWHVAGDPTLIIILSGTLRLFLRNGEHRDFTKGDQFIAADYLDTDVDFDQSIHGHSAEVIGETTLEAVHIKLSKR